MCSPMKKMAESAMSIEKERTSKSIKKVKNNNKKKTTGIENFVTTERRGGLKRSSMLSNKNSQQLGTGRFD